MGKSYKKTPIIKYAGYGKFGKKQANKKVRRLAMSQSSRKGAFHKRLYQTWNINDVVSHWTRDEAIEAGMLDVWERLYHRK